MVFDVLVAAKGILFRPCRRSAGDEVGGLIVAEARKNGIVVGKIMINADVAGSFVQSTRG